MHFAAAYIGKPWIAGADGPDAFDCWSLCRYVWRTEFGWDVPEIAYTEDLRALAALFRDHPERRRWHEIPRPDPARFATVARDGDAILMRRAKMPIHVGLWLSVDRGGVLHCVQGESARGGGVVFQSPQALADAGWTVHGVYRFEAAL